MTRLPRRPGLCPRLSTEWLPRIRAACLLLAAGISTPSTVAQAELRVLGTELTDDGRLRIRHSAPADHYFILLSGADAARIVTPIGFQLPGPSAGVMEAGLVGSGARFFRVRAVPTTEPLDTDGDSLNDLFELQSAPWLNPLDAQDAALDPDEDGLTNYEEYLRGSDPGTPNELVSTYTSSPASGEADVAVTRETLIYFSAPLAPGSALGTNAVFAEFGGRRLLTRLELSSDRRKASLFYLENLPGSARVQVTVDGDQITDHGGRTLDADRDGRQGGKGQIYFDTVNLTAAPGTIVVGQVFASELAEGGGTGAGGGANQPLAGVTITVDGREQELRAVTDAEGRFTLSPAPTGTFFVHIDGRTAPDSQWPGGAYYPFVGKAWEAVAGRTNLAGGTGVVYLPRVPAGALQPVSATQPTAVVFAPEILARNPELTGVQIEIPANALFNDAGTRGGRVGIAPVPRDRLPSPLPPGLDLPLVITVQTDGPQNFDQPVPVRFPNSPDPLTGQVLAPGAKSALWSFDHDTGRWEIVGPMTVSADGKYVETDPGVGLRQPGWHGQRPGTTGNGPPGPPPPDFCDKVAEAALGSFYGCAGGKALSGALKAAGGLTIDAVSNTIPGEGVVAFIAGSAGTYAVRQGTFGSPDDAITEALDYEKICCACLASAGVFGSAGCGGKVGLSTASLNSAPELQATRGGIRPDIMLGRNNDAATVALIARLETLTRQYVAIANQHLARVAEARALVGNAKQDSDLPAATLAQLRAIDAELKALLGNRAPADFYSELRAGLQKVESDLMSNLNITGSGPGFYLLENLTTGTAQRGRTDSRGGIPELILPPNQNFRLTRVHATTLAVAISDFPSASTGFTTVIPRGYWLTGNQIPPDADADGLNDLAEKVLGTNPAKADTDNDGIGDAIEVQNGSDPNGDLIQVTGVVGAADTAGTAVDVSVVGNLAAVADLSAGVTLFDVSRPQQPVALAQVRTPGQARAVASQPGRVFVADGSAGFTLLDTQSPAQATVVRSVGLGSDAVAVTEVREFAVVGLADGRVVVIHPTTGRIVSQRSLGNRVSDFALDDSGLLWVATGNRLYSLRISTSGAVIEELGSLSLGAFPEGITGRRRLSIADGRAYVTEYPGYEIIDIANPADPIQLAPAVDRGPNSFKQIIPISPNLGVAAVGINPRPDGTHDVWLYDLSDPRATTNFLAILPTPGITHALALHRGRVLAADGTEGLQVINPLSADTAGNPPTVAIVSPVTGTSIPEGTPITISARAVDDVLVARVEFMIDGAPLADDGAYPFAAGYVVPSLAPDRTQVRLRAKATDTGGNIAWSDEVIITIARDQSPPVVEYVSPQDSSVVGATRQIQAVFSEALATDAFTGSFRLWSVPEGRVIVASETPPGNPLPGTVAVAGNTLLYSLPLDLPEGRYLAEIGAGIRDRAGNALTQPVRWQFLARSFQDADADGVPDELEASLGLNPTSADTNGNGVPDGAEDFDRDGVPNAIETVAGFDPRNPRSRLADQLDGRIDSDLDGLPDWREVLMGTRLDLEDTDGDGWSDGVEVEVGTHPLSAADAPRLFTHAASVPVLGPGPSSPSWGGGRVPVVIAAPLVLSFAADPENGFGRPLATPSIAPLVLLPGIEANDTFSGQPIAHPPTVVRRAE